MWKIPKKNRVERKERYSARALGNYFTANGKNSKNENCEKWRVKGNKKREKEKEGDIRKEWRNGEKGNENEAGTVASEV